MSTLTSRSHALRGNAYRAGSMATHLDKCKTESTRHVFNVYHSRFGKFFLDPYAFPRKAWERGANGSAISHILFALLMGQQ